jgi:Immunity protein Imm1
MDSMSDNGKQQRQATLSWASDASVPVGSVRELDERLDELDRQAREDDKPLVAGIQQPDGRALSIGLGRDRSVLNYMASLDPPYYTSHDPEVDDNGDWVVFYYYGHWSEYPEDAAVPMDDAREAAHRFLETGERPENIDWRMD